MQDYSEAMQNHINLIKGKSNWRYQYVTDINEMHQIWLNRQKDLGYPLRVEPKRDRFVMNSEALERDLSEAITEALEDSERDLMNAIGSDLTPYVESIMNSMTVIDGQFKATKPDPNSFMLRVTKLFGRQLGKNIMSIFKDITGGGRSRRRRR